MGLDDVCGFGTCLSHADVNYAGMGADNRYCPLGICVFGADYMCKDLWYA